MRLTMPLDAVIGSCLTQVQCLSHFVRGTALLYYLQSFGSLHKSFNLAVRDVNHTAAVHQFLLFLLYEKLVGGAGLAGS